MTPTRYSAGMCLASCPAMRSAVGVLLLLSACTVSDEQEAELGRQGAAQVERELPLVADERVAGFVRVLGDSLARVADATLRTWTFRVVDAKEPNAFALPGGFVYVNRGILERAGDASQLAGVLGHEIAHVTRRHGVDRMQKARGADAGLTILCTLTDVCSSPVAQVGINVAAGALFARYSRQDEEEADADAVATLARAGFHPAGIPALFEKLLEERRDRPLAVERWFSTHPLEEERVAETRRLIAAMDQAALQRATRDLPSFRAMKRALADLPPPPAPPDPSRLMPPEGGP